MPQISLLQRHARLSEDNFIQKEPVMYTALYRSHRPETFNEVLGQEHIIKILKNQIATGRVSHAYLFCGTRGTGKTTTARILAKLSTVFQRENGHAAPAPTVVPSKKGTL